MLSSAAVVVAAAVAAVPSIAALSTGACLPAALSGTAAPSGFVAGAVVGAATEAESVVVDVVVVVAGEASAARGASCSAVRRARLRCSGSGNFGFMAWRRRNAALGSISWQFFPAPTGRFLLYEFWIVTFEKGTLHACAQRTLKFSAVLTIWTGLLARRHSTTCSRDGSLVILAYPRNAFPNA